MRNFIVTKTGRGMYITPFGLHRKALHRSKKGGSLLLSPFHGSSDGGLNTETGGTGFKKGGQLPLHQEKPAIENIQKRLEELSIKGGTKKKNVRFMV